jgi:hypothetical protein
MMADITYNDPDTDEILTPAQWESQKEDCATRLIHTQIELNCLLRRAAALGLERKVVVFDHNESKTRLKCSDGNVIYLPQRIQGISYQIVFVLPPEVTVGDPEDSPPSGPLFRKKR